MVMRRDWKQQSTLESEVSALRFGRKTNEPTDPLAEGGVELNQEVTLIIDTVMMTAEHPAVT